MSDKKKPTYKEKNGTTRVGDFLRTLKGVAPDVLSVAGSLTGLDALKNLGKMIEGTDSISETDKEFALKQLEFDMIDAQETTKRWQADMTSDSWLSKNVRPLIVMFLTLVLAVFIILDSYTNKFIVKEDWIGLLTSLLLLVYGAYFGGRSLEKIQKTRNG